MRDDLPPLPPEAPRPGEYRHFKGGRYRVTGVGRNSEDLGFMVMYRSLDRPSDLPWLRPLAEWVRPLPSGRPRFERMAPAYENCGDQDNASCMDERRIGPDGKLADS